MDGRREGGAEAAFGDVFEEFERLEALMTVWREGSDIVRFNAAAGVQPVPISPEVRDSVRIASQVSEWTGGKFDVTFGALSGLWKFDTRIRTTRSQSGARCASACR